MLRKLLSLAAITAVAAALPAWAHHSNVMYERERTLSVTGTVKEFTFMNPHSWLYVTVTDADGQTKLWALESSSTASLLRRGWTRETVKPGDPISATFRPMRDGSLGGELESVTLADGRTLR
jgi:hypothetical protein